MTSNAVQIKLSTNPEMLSARTAGICIRVHVDGRRGASDRSGDGESHLLMFILRFVGRVCGVRSRRQRQSLRHERAHAPPQARTSPARTQAALANP